MAHEVSFSVPERPLGKADVEFIVEKNGAKLGTLRVSKGSIVWVPVDHTYGYKVGWTSFAKLMEENGTDGHK